MEKQEKWDSFEIKKTSTNKKESVHVCRTCAHDNMILCKINSVQNLKEKLSTYLEIKVTTEDNLSQEICINCVKTLNNFDEFVKMCKESQKMLKSGQVRKKQRKTPNKSKSMKKPITPTALSFSDLEDSEMVECKGSDENFFEEIIVNEFNESNDNLNRELHFEELDDKTISESDTKTTIKFKVQKGSQTTFSKSKSKNIKAPIKVIKISSEESNISQEQNELHFSEFEDDEIGFDCRECFFHCKTKEELEEHHRKSHKTPDKTVDTSLNKLSNVVCDKCGFIAKNWIRLKCHLQYHHTESDEPLKCDFKKCEKLTFSNKYKLKKHMCCHRSKTAVCPECGKELGSNNQLKVHIKGVHQNIRDHVCLHCGKGFSQPYKLKVHLLSHTKKAEYECKECGCMFVYRHMMNQHVERHHQSSKSGS